MSVVDRLRTLDTPLHQVDVDETLARVRGRARRRRRGRIVTASLIVVLLAGAGFAATALDADDAQLDTAGHRGPIVRYLPTEVPAGFTLAWVDPESPVETGADDPVPWHDSLEYDYAFGYRSGGLELEALVYVGVGFDPRHVVNAWGERSEIITDEQGRTMVLDDSSAPSRVLVEREHAAILVVGHSLGAGFEGADELRSFARSMRPVSAEQWSAAISTADAVPVGNVGEHVEVVAGEGWSLIGQRFRAPRSVTSWQIGLHVGESQMVGLAASVGEVPDIVDVHIDPVGDTNVVWGTAPPGTATVELLFVGSALEIGTVPLGEGMVFAISASDVDGDPRSARALDSAGEVITAVVDHTQGTCVEAGDPTIDVPNVVGRPLWDAVRAIESVGLTVLGTGTPPDDPIDPGATISAQEPPAGTRLPKGACVGFRTTSR